MAATTCEIEMTEAESLAECAAIRRRAAEHAALVADLAAVRRRMAACETGRRDSLLAGNARDARAYGRVYGELYREERNLQDALEAL